VNRTAAAGYWLAPQARGSGFAAEALAALAAWGFATLGLERIQLQAAEDNVASQRVALRAGFRFESRSRRAGRCGGKQTDMLIFGRLRDDPERPAPRLLPDVDTLSDGTVVLRPMRAEDAADWHVECTDPEVLRWSISPIVPELTDTQRRAAGVAARWLAGTEARFAITAGGKYAGHICLRLTEPEIAVGEVGYALHPACRGRGLMRRALPLVAGWALTEVGLARVTAGVVVTNRASLRTAAAAGFRREGVLRQGLPGPDGRYDVVLLSIVRDQPHQKDAAITP
ncbi:MAG: GNAT family protein, partial [Pseudonocardiales bacterium]